MVTQIFDRRTIGIPGTVTPAMQQLRDETVQAAAEVADAIAGQGYLTASGGGDLLIVGEDYTDTWMQARNEIDAATGMSLPTDRTLEAFHQVGIPAATGGGEDLIIVGDNDVEVGVPVIYQGPVPDAIDLPAGAARIYLNDGEPVLVVGS